MIINSPVNVLNSKKFKTWQKDGKISSSILLPDSAKQANYYHKHLTISSLTASEKSSGEMAEWSNALVC
jgi:hypothetical protein